MPAVSYSSGRMLIAYRPTLLKALTGKKHHFCINLSSQVAIFTNYVRFSVINFAFYRFASVLFFSFGDALSASNLAENWSPDGCAERWRYAVASIVPDSSISHLKPGIVRPLLVDPTCVRGQWDNVWAHWGLVSDHRGSSKRESNHVSPRRWAKTTYNESFSSDKFIEFCRYSSMDGVFRKEGDRSKWLDFFRANKVFWQCRHQVVLRRGTSPTIIMMVGHDATVILFPPKTKTRLRCPPLGLAMDGDADAWMGAAHLPIPALIWKRWTRPRIV